MHGRRSYHHSAECYFLCMMASEGTKFSGDLSKTHPVLLPTLLFFRMLSNRESARRSRSRKQAQISELETQASQLRVENTTFCILLADISQKYDEAAVDNRVLKADVETLRAKVKMAEETVKRITGLNPFMQFTSEISTTAPSSSHTSSDSTLPLQDDLIKQQGYTAHPNNRCLLTICESKVVW